MDREVSYERNLTGSYMKIPAYGAGGMDEQILLAISLPGLLPIQRYQVNGENRYLYTISGKQSLETICSLKPIGIGLIEQLIISICCEAEILEKYLVDMNCMVLDPETIFLMGQTREIFFTVIPSEKKSLLDQIRILMEYLLTKIDHNDQETVHASYRLYERTLEEGYSMKELKTAILEGRQEARKEQERETAEEDDGEEKSEYENTVPGKQKEESKPAVQNRGLKGKTEKKPADPKKNAPKSGWMDHFLEKIFKESKTQDIVVMPEDVEPEPEPEYFATVCLTDRRLHAEGILVYEGTDSLEDIRLTSEDTVIGQGEDASARIRRETVSRCHAHITRQEGEYYLEDLNSTNGTYLNGELLSYKQIRKLAINDRICFADVKYRFV